MAKFSIYHQDSDEITPVKGMSDVLAPDVVHFFTFDTESPELFSVTQYDSDGEIESMLNGSEWLRQLNNLAVE